MQNQNNKKKTKKNRTWCEHIDTRKLTAKKTGKKCLLHGSQTWKNYFGLLQLLLYSMRIKLFTTQQINHFFLTCNQLSEKNYGSTFFFSSYIFNPLCITREPLMIPIDFIGRPFAKYSVRTVFIAGGKSYSALVGREVY